jgi:hypothetical protein
MAASASADAAFCALKKQGNKKDRLKRRSLMPDKQLREAAAPAFVRGNQTE